ncbi:periplasmic heavy metal sensor [Chitinophaga sp. SYP-B3965]|uniref:Spy/CpxP family protein refolding chaperone n=1 Tax=Chitinophaga sp. SYP-B3965 TaxID=2663120 RepID=UPI001299EADE|nr:periplasmic heavy metal sensor [Chitinophaga sp. SYP-B3965]MRG45387.1 periplasmic heavy metal sensor [Chitinophaga sp. SYP-B3965]
MKETFARNKILSLLLVFLLLTNIGMLVFFVYTKPEPPKKGNDKDNKGGEMLQLLEKQVGFTPEQLAKYKSLKEVHWNTVKPYFGEMRTAKDNFFKLISTAVPDSVINAAADTIAAKQKKIDVTTFRYFQELRAVCTPQQQPAFDSVVSQVVKKMNAMGRNRNQPPKDSVKQ